MDSAGCQSKTSNTALVQLLTALLVALIGFVQAEDTGKLLLQLLGPEGLALLAAGLLSIKSFWDIWIRFNTTKAIKK